MTQTVHQLRLLTVVAVNCHHIVRKSSSVYAMKQNVINNNQNMPYLKIN